jgi:hypothetical protein
MISNVKEVSRFSSPVLQYLMISWRPYYLPRGFSKLYFYVAVYLPPQTKAGIKTALNELHRGISKQENAHTEVALLVASDFNAGKLKSVLPHFYSTHRKAYKTLPRL